jgi:hypothetical protein
MENNTPNALPTPPNQEEKISQSNPPKSGYYTRTRRKVGDFFLGFFGSMVLSLLLVVLSAFLSSLSADYSLVSSLFSLALSVFLIVFFFRKGRRFIAIGMISMILLPLLAFGSCLVLIMGTGNKF